MIRKVIFLGFFCMGILFLSAQNDQNQHSMIQQPEWTKNVVIYQVNTRQFSASGKFSEVTAQLPRLKDLGVDIVWLMPIHPIGEKNRKGKLGSPYAVRDYKAVNPELGTLDDLKQLVNTAHSLGMKVILDWVANHTSWDNVWLKDHLDYYTSDAQGNRPIITLSEDNKTPTDWDDTADLDYSNPKLHTAMIDALQYWLKEADIDGFRCDVACFIPVDFWVQARKSLEEIKPVFMLAECDYPYIYQAFNLSYGWKFYDLMVNIQKGKSSLKDIQTYLDVTNKAFSSNDLIMYFTTNHDKNTWEGTDKELYDNNADNFAILTYSLGGIPLIYNGQESGLDKRLDFFEHDPIDWENYSKTDFYKTLISLYKSNPALWNGIYRGEIKILEAPEKPGLFIYTVTKNKNTVTVVQNYSNVPIAVSADKLPKKLTDKLTNKKLKPVVGRYILPANQ
ncbi:MAG: hypothetical protein LBT29_02760, partial [Flavobacteriaceae bacterium]|nr:hypothetical protein [Flavobacteriaceae bacterium]